MNRTDESSNLPAGTLETSPLMVGIIGISLPVALLALAAVTGSVVALVFAVLSMLAVGAATLLFVTRLASDPADLDHGNAHAE
ncbi:MAG: hypothetical protein ACLPUT_12500 [Solirubrobacteraceae bacterium]|jgi:hypothetical protein